MTWFRKHFCFICYICPGLLPQPEGPVPGGPRGAGLGNTGGGAGGGGQEGPGTTGGGGEARGQEGQESTSGLQVRQFIILLMFLITKIKIEVLYLSQFGTLRIEQSIFEELWKN